MLVDLTGAVPRLREEDMEDEFSLITFLFLFLVLFNLNNG